jgi:choline dehydrogenase-like flavoprotein
MGPGIRALRFRARLFGRRVSALEARDLVGKKDVSIRARKFVLAAGPIASSKILLRSVFQVLSPVGQRIAANVVLPVFALLRAPDPMPDPRPREPGIQMCVYVDQNGRLLETWFHYPASLAIALPEWLREHAAIMLQYHRLAACGVVVPTANSGELGPHGELVLSLSAEELRQMVEGVISVAGVFFQAGTEKVFPASRLPNYFRHDHREEDAQAFRQRIRGPGDLTLSTAHPQGGNAIGRRMWRSVVSPGFSLYDFANLFVADASLFPAGCHVNPQMTAMALATLAADRVIASG